jgi:hypothetical protein
MTASVDTLIQSEEYLTGSFLERNCPFSANHALVDLPKLFLSILVSIVFKILLTEVT